MIHSEQGRIATMGNTEELREDITLALTTFLMRAKCRDRARLMNIGINIVNNAVDILEEIEKEKAEEKISEEKNCEENSHE